MKSAIQEERIFPHGIDPVDGILCLSADARPEDIRNLAAPHGWRFPLQGCKNLPLREQVAASPYANASSRFGPWCDNITGMNWARPDGRILRLGEQVVKSTTGYDLMRYLLGTGERFGRAVDYVLRLRPLCSGEALIYLDGDSAVLARAVSELLMSSFLPWLEVVDWLEPGAGRASRLRLAVHTPAEELPIFENFAQNFAHAHGLEFSMERAPFESSDGLPDLVFKTTPDRTVALARDLSRKHPLRTVALCACGVVHAFALEGHVSEARAQALAEPCAETLEALGGDWQSRHLPLTEPRTEERRWIETLMEALV